MTSHGRAAASTTITRNCTFASKGGLLFLLVLDGCNNGDDCLVRPASWTRRNAEDVVPKTVNPPRIPAWTGLKDLGKFKIVGSFEDNILERFHVRFNRIESSSFSVSLFHRAF